MLLLPSALSAQLEFGIDSGIRIEKTVGISRTTLRIPSEWLRVGLRFERFGFESLINFANQRVSGESATEIELLPGISYDALPIVLRAW